MIFLTRHAILVGLQLFSICLIFRSSSHSCCVVISSFSMRFTHVDLPEMKVLRSQLMAPNCISVSSFDFHLTLSSVSIAMGFSVLVEWRCFLMVFDRGGHSHVGPLEVLSSSTFRMIVARVSINVECLVFRVLYLGIFVVELLLFVGLMGFVLSFSLSFSCCISIF